MHSNLNYTLYSVDSDPGKISLQNSNKFAFPVENCVWKEEKIALD